MDEVGDDLAWLQVAVGAHERPWGATTRRVPKLTGRNIIFVGNCNFAVYGLALAFLGKAYALTTLNPVLGHSENTSR